MIRKFSYHTIAEFSSRCLDKNLVHFIQIQLIEEVLYFQASDVLIMLGIGTVEQLVHEQKEVVIKYIHQYREDFQEMHIHTLLTKHTPHNIPHTTHTLVQHTHMDSYRHVKF